MVTEEEKQEIVDLAIEQLMKVLPEMVGNLVKLGSSHAQMFMKFYNDYPQFRDHKEIVGQAIMEVEGRNPLRPYSEIVEKAVPRIETLIKEKGKVTMDPVKFDDLDLQSDKRNLVSYERIK